MLNFNVPAWVAIVWIVVLIAGFLALVWYDRVALKRIKRDGEAAANKAQTAAIMKAANDRARRRVRAGIEPDQAWPRKGGV